MKVVLVNGSPKKNGTTADLARQDGEGLRTVRNLGRNMAWMLQCLEAGREKGVLPSRRRDGASHQLQPGIGTL